MGERERGKREERAIGEIEERERGVRGGCSGKADRDQATYVTCANTRTYVRTSASAQVCTYGNVRAQVLNISMCRCFVREGRASFTPRVSSCYCFSLMFFRSCLVGLSFCVMLVFLLCRNYVFACILFRVWVCFVSSLIHVPSEARASSGLRFFVVRSRLRRQQCSRRADSRQSRLFELAEGRVLRRIGGRMGAWRRACRIEGV